MARRPRNAAEAQERLQMLAEQLRQHLTEYEPHETLASADLLQWLVDAISEQRLRRSTLDQALGLARYRGEKTAKPGKHFKTAVEVFQLRNQGMSWGKVTEKVGFFDQRELQKICEREAEHVVRHFAEIIGKKLRSRGAK